MLKRNRLLLISSSVVLLCLSIVVGATFALFTEEASVEHHLQAGNLTASLVRHSYTYTVLGDDGVMKTVKSSDIAADNKDKDVDFSDANTSNFFGLDNSKQIKMVPGCSFNAVFTIANEGSTAFTYSFDFVGVDGKTISNDFAKQLQVDIVAIKSDNTTTNVASGTVYSFLNDAGSVYTANGNEALIVDGKSATKFSVTVTFVSSGDNNNAENGTVWFDFVVNATQYTGK